MIETRYLDGWLNHLVAERAATCDAFLGAALYDRTLLEETIRRMFNAAVDFLYVGTVHRGLAGSTSDIDILVLLEGPGGQLPMPMIQHRNDRRVGVQTMDLQLLRDTLGVFERWIDEDHVPEPHEIRALKVSPKMIERAVNGLSFDARMPLQQHLATFAEIVARIEAQSVYAAAVWAEMARFAKRVSAAEGYWLEAEMHARDCVMAAGGEVQANRKWVGERWHRFRAQAQPPRLGSMVEQVDKLSSAIGLGDPQIACACVRDLFDLLGVTTPDHLGVDLAPAAVRRELTREATMLGGDTVALCLPTEVLDTILTDRRAPFDELDEGEANLMLELARTGMLRIASLRMQAGGGERP